MSGFKLAPSRLNRPPASDDAVASPATKTNFVGLTASKLGLLAEPKLTPSSGAIQAKSSNGDAATDSAESAPQSSSILATPSTFSFTPLTKPVDEASKKEERAKDEEKAGDGGEQRVAKMPVFGENLSEKVTAVPSTEATATAGQILKEPPEEKTEDVTNAGKFVASSLLFSNAAKASDDESEKKTLSESAAEYTESHTNKRKYDVVDVVTGEEAESNVLQGQVKLYIFDKEKRNWTERGRGQLRLNDSAVSKPGHLRSRLVVRTSGNMRVVLNTKLWSDMICEKANEKSIRISALDEGEVKIFLIACSIKEAEKLHTALEYRINQLKTDKENGEGEEDESVKEKDDGDANVSPEKRMKPSEEKSSTEA